MRPLESIGIKIMMTNSTIDLIQAAAKILEKYHPMTLRQVYYQLVAAQVIENKRSSYQRLSVALVKARKELLIDWEMIEDRVRKPYRVSMWNDLPDFIETVKRAYRRDVWNTQEIYLEVWLEKDALSGVFSIVQDYGITLVVGRGYNSWSAYKEAYYRFRKYPNRDKYILYFGDFDPSGEDIVRAIRDSYVYFTDDVPEVIKVALTRDDIDEYNLPPDFTKSTDSRSAKFVEEHGDIAVELDALPLPVLQRKIRDSIGDYMDLEAITEVEEIESKERIKLSNIFKKKK